MDGSSKTQSGSEDGSHIFEVYAIPVIYFCRFILLMSDPRRVVVITLQAIGLLIGMEDVPLEKQSDYLAALLNPLCQQVKFDCLL